MFLETRDSVLIVLTLWENRYELIPIDGLR